MSSLSDTDNRDNLITIELSELQYAKLLEVLYQFDDGPPAKDCPSKELEQLRYIVEAASLTSKS